MVNATHPEAMNLSLGYARKDIRHKTIAKSRVYLLAVATPAEGSSHKKNNNSKEQKLRVRVSHLLGSCHKASAYSPLLLLGRGLSLPSLLSCIASSHPGNGQHFRFWQSVLSEGN